MFIDDCDGDNDMSIVLVTMTAPIQTMVSMLRMMKVDDDEFGDASIAINKVVYSKGDNSQCYEG